MVTRTGTGGGSRRLLSAACALLLLSACQRVPARARLTLAGSSSVQPFVEKWAEAFLESTPAASAIAFDVQGGGSSAGIRAVREEAAIVGMSSRSLAVAEQEGLITIEAARDAIAVIVHPENPLPGLSRAQLEAVFTGRSTRWLELGVADLGGARGVITVVSREEGSGTRSAFEQLALQGQAVTPRALVQDAGGAIRELVAHDPAAIGYISAGLVDKRVRALALGGALPTAKEVREGRYPLVRPFLLVLRAPLEQAPESARSFLRFVLSGAGQQIARAEGLLPAE